MRAVIDHIPAPEGDSNSPLKALLFDSWFDSYRGVMCLMTIKDGAIKKGDLITLAHDNLHYEVLEIGLMYPDETTMRCTCMLVKLDT